MPAGRTHSDAENSPPASTSDLNAFRLGPRQRPRAVDPLVGYGRHFGRSVHAFCNVSVIINAGILRLGTQAGRPESEFTSRQQREFRAFNALLEIVPKLKTRLFADGSDSGVVENIASLLQKGVSQARSDDTKGMKGPIIEWITPPGENLNPPLPRHLKAGRGFNHEATGALLCPTSMSWDDARVKRRLASGELTVPGDQWPVFLYLDFTYDECDPWKGLLRSELLVTAYRHVFTSPSSVHREVKATRQGNARIHGMTRVSAGSLAYIATQVRFALSSSGTFSRTNDDTDSECFYNSILDLLEDPDEHDEVNSLIAWWNRRVFSGWDFQSRRITTNSARDKIRELRAQKKAAAAASMGRRATNFGGYSQNNSYDNGTGSD